MKAPLLLVFASCIACTACIPGAIPGIKAGNTATTITETQAPDHQQDAENTAPIFHINVYANPRVDAVGRDASSKGEGVVEATAVPARPAVPVNKHGTTAPLPVNDTVSKTLLAPRNKGDEPVLIGPVWGGATVDDFNRMVCERVAVANRIPPVESVFEGCRPYWD